LGLKIVAYQIKNIEKNVTGLGWVRKATSTTISKYFSKIGRRGGRTSRRELSSNAAKEMVRIREARRIYRRFHSLCFWSFDPQYLVTAQDIPWVIDRLRRNGDRQSWEAALSLCR
jgi:hypothetical protein